MDWLLDNKLPIGPAAKIAVDWLIGNVSWFFDGLSVALRGVIDALLWLLQTPHPFVVIALVAGFALWRSRSWRLTLFVIAAFLLIINQGYWEETTETLSLVLSAGVVCMGLGVPIGIYAARRPLFYTALRPVLDLMQTIPTFVYLIPALILFGLGMVPGLIATVIFAIPAPIRLTQLGISSTPLALKEAALAFGASRRQLLWKVEIPWALPQIMAGLTQTIMLSLSMVVIAALVGADGLGVPTLRALNQVNIARGFEVGGGDCAGCGGLGSSAGAGTDAPSRFLKAMKEAMNQTTESEPEEAEVVADAVNVVFGTEPKSALAAMDAGKTREEIREETGQVLGVHNASFVLHKREIFVLMGLSGSGKSTLLRAVNGLAPVVRGEMRVRAGDEGLVSVTHAKEATLRTIRGATVAMVFQQFGLLPWRSVLENVALGLELSKVNRETRRRRAGEQLELVGLSGTANLRVESLSGGMQQRVGLARAFVTEAPILLMDEPFSALDPLIRAKLQDELLVLQSQLKRSILFVCHDLDEAVKIGSRIAIMEGGRIVQQGTPQEIVLRPATDYVAEFVSHMNPMNVLCAADIMCPTQAEGQEVSQTTGAGTQVAPDTPVRELMRLQAEQAQRIQVVSDGKTLGWLGAEEIFTAILREVRAENSSS